MGSFLTRRSFVRIVTVLTTIVIFGVAWSGRAEAATIDVTTTEDEYNDDSTEDEYNDDSSVECSLREAIKAANDDAPFGGCETGSGDDEIILNEGNYELTHVTNEVTSLKIESNLSITGRGSNLTSIVSGGRGRVIEIAAGFTVRVLDLRIQGGVQANGNGGGILNNGGNLTLENVVVDDNSADKGGGIYNEDGSLTIINSGINNNRATKVKDGSPTDGGLGGGIYSSGSASYPSTVTIKGSTISNNSSTWLGGGIFNGGVSIMTIEGINDNQGGFDMSVVSGNEADEMGGGIDNSGQGASLTILRTKIINNRITSATLTYTKGGGIYNAGKMTLYLSQITGNTNDRGFGGGYMGETYPGHTPQRSKITNTIISDNTADYGGGIVNRVGLDDGTEGLKVITSTIEDNSARIGGGVNSGTDAHDKSKAIFENCTIQNNTATQVGGGFFVDKKSDVFVTKSRITNNLIGSPTTGGGNGGAFHNKGKLTINSSTINSNQSAGMGGAIFNFADATYVGEVTVADTTIEGNIARGDDELVGDGGGFFNYGGILKIDNSTLFLNRSIGGDGGGIYNFMNSTDSAATPGEAFITNSTFHTNKAGRNGGGIYAHSGEVELLHDTIIENTAAGLSNDTTSGGGGIYINEADVLILNSVIAGNISETHSDPYQTLAHDCVGGVESAKNTFIGINSTVADQAPFSCTFDNETNVYQGSLDDVKDPFGNVTLADNGGPTKTVVIKSGGYLLRSEFRSSEDCTPTDQRGVARNTSGCFWGAYEPVCGDGNVAGNEACDDGNFDNNDSCLGTCVAAICGDRVVWAGVEACDDGNGVDNDECRNNCALPSCGDGVVQAGEGCDDANGDNTDTCLSTCLAAICGDSFIQTGVEVCDDGNIVSGDECRADCLGLEVCGDGLVDTGEVCDDGNAASGDGCRADCLGLEVCGDGLVDTGEECDTGAARSDNAADACRLNCRDARCGDGVKDGPEGCDDGNGVDNDECRNDCALPSCGDGVVQAGEGCDDANGDNTDECLNTCVIASCGDEFIQTDVETCDDGNRDSGDGCRGDCRKIERCGDGEIDSGEECDDANSDNADACLDICIIARCGDGIIQTGVETCDDSNTAGGDGCSPECQIEVAAPVEVIEGGSPASATPAAPKAKGGCSLIN